MKTDAQVQATRLALLLLLGTLLAGCGKPQAAFGLDPVEEAIAATPGKVLHGRVLTDEVVPLGEALVELLDGDGNVTTDPSGNYLLAGLESRDYLVRVAVPGYYPEVQRAAMTLGRDFRLDFYLARMPTGEPRQETQVFQAFISCQAAVVVDFPGTTRHDCGAADPNNARSTVFTFAPHSTGFVLEFDWEPTTACASTLDFGLHLLLENGTHTLDESTITPGETIRVPPAYFALKQPFGGEVRANLNVDRCGGIGGPGLGAGFVAQQRVDVHFTAFYFQPVPDDFSVKNG